MSSIAGTRSLARVARNVSRAAPRAPRPIVSLRKSIRAVNTSACLRNSNDNAIDPELEELLNKERAQLDNEAAKTPSASSPQDIIIEENENTFGEASTEEFQAETRKILDIVAKSLYSDKEIFVRELISNASDALEKVRHLSVQGKDIVDPDVPLEIRISVDDKKKILIIQDTGVGMTKAELQRNLGRIGFSGTSEFLKVLEDQTRSSNLIGQFGVGFYSAFMVATKIKVYSKGALEKGSRGWVWESDGSGTYSISQAEPVQRGTKIVIYLRQDSEEFAVKQTLEQIVKTYSNFVSFNIYLNGHPVNTIKALWTLPANEITPEMHKEFYQFISKAYDAPMYTLQFSTDMPLSLRSLFYIPETHMEKYGMGRQEIGVSLYSRKVLIQAKCKGLLPDWLRFVKGIVDSEDVPLNLSREHLQDSALIKRLSGVLTRRLIKFLEKEAKNDSDKYAKFYSEFNGYIKEGICTDYVNKEEISRLLRMESSSTAPGEFTTLDDYVSRMKGSQTDIYYLIVPSRAMAENSPYFESFKEAGIEVLFFYDARLDDFVMSNLGEFQGKKLKTIESSSSAPTNTETHRKKTPGLSADEFKSFSSWVKDLLVDKVTTVTETDRLSSTPCIIVDHESASFRRMMKAVDPKNAPELPKQQINARHPLVLKLNDLRKHESTVDVAKEAMNQIFDNALIQAGLMDDARSMVPRINKMLETTLFAASKNLADSGVPLSSNSSESSESSNNSEPEQKNDDDDDDPFVHKRSSDFKEL